jgi:hypothetical protein
MDLKSYNRWYDYSRARDAMFAATDTAWAPWYMVQADQKRRARLNLVAHLLSKVPYKKTKGERVKLPPRQKAGGYREPDHSERLIPQKVLGTGGRMSRPWKALGILSAVRCPRGRSARAGGSAPGCRHRLR